MAHTLLLLHMCSGIVVGTCSESSKEPVTTIALRAREHTADCQRHQQLQHHRHATAAAAPPTIKCGPLLASNCETKP